MKSELAQHNSNKITRLVFSVRGCWTKYRALYIMFIPVAVYYIMFHYKPMYGALMAFQNYNPVQGIWNSEWVGFENFIEFFTDHYFGRLIRNTLTISFSLIVFGFPAPILLALLMNEIGKKQFKKAVQTISYLPHFISTVVVCGLIKSFTSDTGAINDVVAFFGGERVSLLNHAKNFVPIYIISDIWQSMGWGSIIYLAALSGISEELYEASYIDGANRFKQTIHVTIPGILPTIVIMFILRVGNILNVGYEKIILLYNPMTLKTADVISTYVYRKGLLELDWSYSTAVGLFNSIINFIFLIAANHISKRATETSLW